MKRMKHILALAALVLAMVSCGKKVDVNLSPESVDFTPDGGEAEIALTSNGDWQVEANYEWLSVTPTSGNGNATLVVTAVPNDGSEARDAQVKVTTKNNEALLAVHQDFSAVPFLRVEPNQINCDRLGGMFDVAVYSNIDWTISTLPDGVTVSVDSGSGNATVTLTIAPLQNSFADSEKQVVFAGGNILAPVTIKQSVASSYDVVIDPVLLDVGYEGGTKTINVTCEGDWTVESTMDWATLSAESGSGNGQVVVTVAANDVYEIRAAQIIFHSSVGTSKTAMVRQQAAPDPHYLTVDPSELTFGSEGGTASISIGCDVEWEIDLNSDWATISSTTGTGDATVTLTVEPNLVIEPRQLSLFVKSGMLNHEINVQQAAGDQPLNVTLLPDTIVVPSSGATSAELNVSSNTSWQLQASEWISNLPASLTYGDATVYLIVNSYTDPEPRYGFVRAIHNGQVMDEVVVMQEGKPDLLEVDVTEFDVRPEGAEFTFHVTSNQAWTVSVDFPWISCNPVSGLGSRDVTVTVQPSMSTHPRTGHIKVTAASGKMVTVIINQGY